MDKITYSILTALPHDRFITKADLLEMKIDGLTDDILSEAIPELCRHKLITTKAKYPNDYLWEATLSTEIRTTYLGVCAANEWEEQNQRLNQTDDRSKEANTISKISLVIAIAAIIVEALKFSL